MNGWGSGSDPRRGQRGATVGRESRAAGAGVTVMHARVMEDA